MKKYISLVALLVASGSAFAQGTITFANNAATQVRFGATGSYSNGVAAPINLSSVEFLWAAQGTPALPYAGGSLTAWLSANPGWEAIAASFRVIGPTVGRFNAGVITANTTVPGGIVQAFVVGWYTPGGAQPSFDAALNDPLAYVGFSLPFTLDTANPLALPTPETPTALTSSGYAGLVVTPVPEPATLALAGLGAAAMLIIRRRR
jgi:hypothetical protein